VVCLAKMARKLWGWGGSPAARESGGSATASEPEPPPPALTESADENDTDENECGDFRVGSPLPPGMREEAAAAATSVVAVEEVEAAAYMVATAAAAAPVDEEEADSLVGSPAPGPGKPFVRETKLHPTPSILLPTLAAVAAAEVAAATAAAEDEEEEAPAGAEMTTSVASPHSPVSPASTRSPVKSPEKQMPHPHLPELRPMLRAETESNAVLTAAAAAAAEVAAGVSHDSNGCRAWMPSRARSQDATLLKKLNVQNTCR
jgi:hypothetical protein